MYSSLIKLLKESSIVVWMLSFYVFIWFMQIGNRIDILGTIRIEFIVGSILVALSLKAWMQSTADPQFYHQAFRKSIFILYALFVIYTFASYDRETSWNVFSDRILKFSMFTLFISVLVKNKSELILVLLGFFLAMLKIIQEGMFGIVSGGMIWENQGIPRLHGVTMMYRHPNSLSGLAVGALPFFLFLFRFIPGLLKIPVAVGIIGLLMIIMYTGSRTGYVATMILFFAVLLRLGIFRFKTIFILLVSAIVAFTLIPQDYKDRFGTMFKSEQERGSSANKRIEILEDAVAIAIKYPLGVGVQAFPFVRDQEFGRQQDTHNLYLEVLTNLGPFGVIAFAIFISLLIKTNNKTREKFLAAKEDFLGELCFVVNLYILCRLALGLFGMDLYEVYWWFAAGLTIFMAKYAVKLEKTQTTTAT